MNKVQNPDALKENATPQATPAPDGSEKKRRGSKKRLFFLLLGPMVILAVGGYLFLTGNRYVATDNAYLKSHKINISAEVSGKAIDVNIHDNQHVEKGDLLFAIDPQQYEIAVQLAQAKLANTKAQIESLRAQFRQKSAIRNKNQEMVNYWKTRNDRYQSLLKTKSVSIAQADEVALEWQKAQEESVSAEQDLAAIVAQLDDYPDAPVENHPTYHAAKAELSKAQLDLDHTKIVAPYSGNVANLNLENGEYIAAGVPLFSIVDDKDIWVEANFKETDLTHIKVGQPATIEVDTYPGEEWHGKVASITAATGAEFSILPPQNATGNWVKVVQRIMVRIEFDRKEKPIALTAGMSTDATVDTGKTRLQRLLEGYQTPSKEQ